MVLFLIVTTGLLVYALIRPYVQSWLAVRIHLDVRLMSLEGAELRERDKEDKRRNMRRYLHKCYGSLVFSVYPMWH